MKKKTKKENKSREKRGKTVCFWDTTTFSLKHYFTANIPSGLHWQARTTHCIIGSYIWTALALYSYNFTNVSYTVLRSTNISPLAHDIFFLPTFKLPRAIPTILKYHLSSVTYNNFELSRSINCWRKFSLLTSTLRNIWILIINVQKPALFIILANFGFNYYSNGLIIIILIFRIVITNLNLNLVGGK